MNNHKTNISKNKLYEGLSDIMDNFLKENFYLGGYYIVKPTNREDWMDGEIFQDVVLSASSCICEFFPDLDIIWSQSEKKKKKYRKELMMDEKTFDEMKEFICERYEAFESQCVFDSYEDIFKFYNRFFSTRDDLKIIGIALPKKFKRVFLEDADENDAETLESEVCKNIFYEKYINPKGKILGYEILGYEYSSFHSYICNNLFDYYRDKYGFKLNENGFISTLEEVEKLVDYTNRENLPSEPVLWLPWILIEYPVK